MSTIPQVVCGVIPPHMLQRVAECHGHDARRDALATLDHLAELASGRTCTLLETPAAAAPAAAGRPRKRRRVFDARHRFRLPGDLVMSELTSRIADVEAAEAFHGSGATHDFFFHLFRRSSIDGRGMTLDSTVHYGLGFENALWNGRQMVYGHADGRLFTRFTASIDVIAHELTHGIIQHAAALGYHGQTGALNEHLSDAFGIMVRQYTLGHTARQSDWLIGAEILAPGVRGRGIRSLACPGSAYDDPVLGRDPQPSHMRGYVETTEDNGGVHINSGILNHGFYRAAMAIGGRTWHVLGRIWYAAMTERLTPDAVFGDFTQATYDLAGELYGNGGRVQRFLAGAWEEVGLPIPHPHPHHTRTAKEDPMKKTNTGEHTSHTIIENARKTVDPSVRALIQEMEHEPTPASDTPVSRIDKVLRIYRGLKPLFAVLGSVPLIPSPWRAALLLLDQSLDALSDVGAELTASFKAGRDLEA